MHITKQAEVREEWALATGGKPALEPAWPLIHTTPQHLPGLRRFPLSNETNPLLSPLLPSGQAPSPAASY